MSTTPTPYSKQDEHTAHSSSTTNTTSSPTTDHLETIDYTPAFRRESQRRDQLDAYFKHHNLDQHIKPIIILNSELTEQQPIITSTDPIFQKNAYFDVLPSFEMYHSSQYHTALRDDEAEVPPVYFAEDDIIDNKIKSPIRQESLDPSVSVGSSSEYITPVTANNPRIPSSSSSVPQSGRSTPTSSANTTQFYDKNIVDNYHKLPQFDHPALNLTIHITKNLPGPDTINTSEAILKEYTSGDIVHGYVIIDNQSDHDVPFRSFYVTLEGLGCVIDPEMKSMTKQKFLMMADLSAMWSTYYISSSSVNQPSCLYGGVDSVDGCFFGLPDERILKAGVKYKKFFTFKFPYRVLDDKCRHGQDLHLLLPPSLGFNRVYKNGKYADVCVDPELKFGYNSQLDKGGPVIVEDMTRNLVSVNYSINAFFVDDQADRCAGKLTVVKHNEHFLRFVPFGFTEASLSLASSKMALEGFKNVIEMNLRNCRNFLEGDIKPKLSINENTYRSSSTDQLPISSAAPLATTADGRPLLTKWFTYQSKQSSATSTLSFLSKRSQPTTNGVLTIQTAIPRDSLPYICPRIIRETNNMNNLTNKAKQNISNLLETLETNEKQILNQISLDLIYETSQTQSSKSTTAILPEIKTVNINLQVLNIFSKKPLPLKLTHDILDIPSNNIKDKENLDYLKTFKSQFIKYKTTYDEYAKKFQMLQYPIDSQFDDDVHKDLQAISEMRCDSFTIDNLFNVQHPIKSDQENLWVQSSPNLYRKDNVVVQFTLNQDRIRQTIIPSFQSCIISRLYFMNVSIKFKDGVKCSIAIPVRVRKFEGDV